LDEWDAPIWTAAVKSKALFIVTNDIAQMPPEGEHGLRTHAGVIYLPAKDFIEVIQEFFDESEAAALPSAPSNDPSVAYQEVGTRFQVQSGLMKEVFEIIGPKLHALDEPDVQT
jgi:hypothetical protein